jgi:hypothetical protein
MTRRHRNGEYCDICGKWCGPKEITDHHLKKRAVFGPNDWNLKPLCRHCHDLVEIEVTKRENTILRENFKNINLDGYSFVKRLVKNERKNTRRNDCYDGRIID